ncbi:MAG: GtrA family protein [Bacteroidales bacterium]|nr:GtrA family protein [Bacteroidales bacterium]
MKRSWKEILRNLVMFSVTSSAGTLVDLGLHWLLSATIFRDSYWGTYWIAPVISFEVAAMVNFIIAYNFLWRDRVSERSVRSFWRHFGAYNAAGVGAFLLKFIVMQVVHFLLRHLGLLQDSTLEPVLCNLIGLCFSGLFNFSMSEFFIFRKKRR